MSLTKQDWEARDQVDEIITDLYNRSLDMGWEPKLLLHHLTISLIATRLREGETIDEVAEHVNGIISYVRKQMRESAEIMGAH